MNAFARLQASEERIIEAIAALAFYDPRDIVQWGKDGLVFAESELLEFAASIKVPGDSAIDVTPEPEEDEE
jgi:hypothetical protein